jgi:DNA-binding NarL/FixJ family response regulator
MTPPNNSPKPYLDPRIKLLLVEDSSGDAQLIRIALARSPEHRFEITLARSLDEARALLEQRPFDAVLLDLCLAESRGVRCLDELGAALMPAPVIALSGTDDESLELACLRHGSQEFIAKGALYRTDLARLVRKVVARHRTPRASQDRAPAPAPAIHADRLESLRHGSSGLAHDLGDLLLTILGNTELALQDLPPQSKLRGYLDEVEDASMAAADLARQLRDRGRDVSASREVVHVSRLVADMTRLIRSKLDPHPTLVFAAGWGQDRGAWVAADIQQMRQAVLQVLLHSADTLATPTGILTLRTGIESQDSRVATTRSDVGPHCGEAVFIEVHAAGAITDARQGSITHVPRQAGSTLADAIDVVQAHGGALRIRHDDTGARVSRIVLPAASAPNAPVSIGMDRAVQRSSVR